MAKFIPLDDAAEMLGITPEELNEMRTRNEIRGFRDGANWKFKPDDVEKAKSDLESGNSVLNLADEVPGDGGDSILLSERELGGSGPVGSSTVIGHPSGDPGPSDSDLSLGDEQAGMSDIELVGDSMIKGSELGIGGSSDVLPAAGSDLGLEFDEPSALDLDMGEGSGSPVASTGSDAMLVGDSDLALGEAEELGVGSDTGSGAGSDIEIEGGSQIDLGEDEDDLVLGGTGSDVIGASDSGISLGDPADSGLSLEGEPLELGGSAIGDESLVLGEDDMISLGDDDINAPTQLKSEDDFLLTPLGDADGDESESGSQVIALDEPGMGFDQSAATMMESDSAAMAMLEEDVSEGDVIGGPAAIAGAVQTAPATLMQPQLPTAPYSIWNVLSLFVCIMILSLGGMLMYDVVRQISSWQGVDPVNSGMMNSLIEMFGG